MRLKLAAALILFLSVILLVSGSVLYLSYKKTLIESSEMRLIHWANTTIIAISEKPRMFREHPESFLFSSSSSEFTAAGVMVQFMDVHGRLLAKSPSLQFNQLPFRKEDNDSIRDTEFEDGAHIKTFQSDIVMNNHLVGYVIIGISTTHLYHNLSTLRVILAGVLFLTFVILGIGITAIVSLNVVRNQRTFLAFASHELRTPLAIISGHAEVALRAPQLAEGYQKTLQVIYDEAQWMNRLVRNLLQIFRSQSGSEKMDMRPCNLADLIIETASKIKHLYPKKTVTLHLNQDGHLTADPDRLMQVLDNLFTNAAVHTPSNGAITVTLSGTEKRLTVAVQDNGKGIPEDVQTKIFDVFYRADQDAHPGMGLGLALSKWIVMQHRGSISVKSSPDKGSVFLVILPRNL